MPDPTPQMTVLQDIREGYLSNVGNLLWSKNKTGEESSAIYFFSGSVLSSQEFLETGYTDFLDFNSSLVLYSYNVTTEYTYRDTGEVEYVTNNEDYYDAMYLPAGSMSILTEFSDNPESLSSDPDTEWTREYSYCEEEVTYSLTTYSSWEFVHTQVDAWQAGNRSIYNDLLSPTGLSEAITSMLLLRPDLPSTEASGLQASLGWEPSTGTSTETAISDRIDEITELLYNRTPTHQYLFYKTNEMQTLLPANMQPISSEEATGMGVGEDVTISTTLSADESGAYVPVDTGGSAY